MNMTNPIIDKFNAICGFVVTLLSYILGDWWFLFVAFLLLNIADYVSGCLKSRLNNKLNSAKGAKGVLKKLGYWLMIMVAFGMSAIFVEIGKTMNVNLEITTMIGWFVLASLIINEIRSILENLIETGYDVPIFLTKGLEIMDKAMKAQEELMDNDKNESEEDDKK